MLTVELQEIPSSDPADQGEEDDWDTVGGPTEGSLSPAPTIEETVPQMAQQTAGTAEPQASAEESRPELSATTRAGGPVAAELKKRCPRKSSSLISPVYLALRS
jgi:hypothetical protein